MLCQNRFGISQHVRAGSGYLLRRQIVHAADVAFCDRRVEERIEKVIHGKASAQDVRLQSLLIVVRHRLAPFLGSATFGQHRSSYDILLCSVSARQLIAIGGKESKEKSALSGNRVPAPILVVFQARAGKRFPPPALWAGL